MLLLQRGVAALSGRMPKVISPKRHAIADYVTAGTFFLLGAIFWQRNQRAAIGALLAALPIFSAGARAPG